ncbi:type VII secretion-associated serine protease mycosin [Actinoplanes aureus]|uniref:Type VII secretion-associated serine protease mycosin n=1 Tax=Actinoplanes aureus TaxID=2792083 RepID=A0A931FZP5_9ACTN|nr:type VII secretion-associated serine protease mycosin [Actinoplanes aureus]MBG0565888.1 type VII secretion-associated serine protease mycosin [Actinoplanes aureus]
MLRAGLAVALVVGWPVPAAAAPACVPPSGRVAAGVPFEVAAYAPGRLSGLATGAGVRVAVLDSGVDPRHPHLRGRVAAGRDLLRGGVDGRRDCVGHGTGVASVIAGRPVAGSGFRGLAPDVTIVPVRVSEQSDAGGAVVGSRGSAAQFAEAIEWAAGRAQVINISLVMTEDDVRVRRAVAAAVGAGVVVVAAAGNAGRVGDGNPVPFPAAYPGVIGVGAVTAEGRRADYSQWGPWVDLVAFGDGVTVAAPGGGHRAARGTSFAAPYVAATAALLRQRFPRADPAEIGRRLVASADPSPAGSRSDEYGFGLLNPYRALTGALPAAATGSPAAATPAPVRDAVALAQRRGQARVRAFWFAGAVFGVLGCAGVVAAVAGRGRRRGWRPAAG